MAKQPGPRAQIWCHTPVTHWMCTGYRFDLLEGRKVEGICTCTCHHSGTAGICGTSHGQNMVDDPARFERARLISREFDEISGLDELDMEEKSNDDRLRELYQKAAETSLLILNEDGTDIMRTPPEPSESGDSKKPLRCSECGANGYSRKTMTPEWRCRKCGHEWQSDEQPA